MNFEIVCSHCGASSSSAVGVCPYCKSVMVSEEEKENPSITKIKNYYSEGNLNQSLLLADQLASSKPEMLTNANFVLLYVQILLEADAPSGKIKSILLHALNDNPAHPQLLEYIELAECESNLSHEKDDAGEIGLANIIRRSPGNVHALFILGAHLFWIEKDTQRALRYLEQCVRQRPNFVRAKACLAAVYKDLNMIDYAARLMKECAAQTTNKSTKEFFRNFAKAKSD